MIQNLAKRIALIQENSSSTDVNQPKRKMGRQMASHGFLESLRRYGGGNPHLVKARLPPLVFAPLRPAGRLFSLAIPSSPFASERL